MLSCLHGIECRPKQGMMHQRRGGITREPHVNAGVNHGLHQQKYVCWSTSRDRRAHVDKRFVFYKDFLSKRRQDLLEKDFLIRIDGTGTAPDGHATSNLRRRVGHTAGNLFQSGPIDITRYGLAGNHAEKGRILVQMDATAGIRRHISCPTNLIINGRAVLWLHSHNNQISIGNRIGDRGGGLDALVLLPDAVHGFVGHVIDAHTVGRHYSGFDDGRDHTGDNKKVGTKR